MSNPSQPPVPIPSPIPSPTHPPPSRQTIEMLEKHIAQGTGGETAKLHSQINSAKKVRIKSEAKLKQRVQDMHKYTDVYRSGMEVEFQRCQEEEHGEDAATECHGRIAVLQL